ncbi:MAG: sulfotransferase family protein [Deltaproteobacteria bacterium]|nr:sulfotransferase family protein [Deltaproteobacteria bacterium]
MKPWIAVVTGLPRSGTSLLMQMLEAGGLPLLYDESRRPDPDNPLGYFEYEPVKRMARDRSWLDAAVGHGVKIVLGLLAHLPRDYAYRVILVERDLGEVMASQRKMLARQGSGGDPTAAPNEIDEEEEALLRGLFDEQLREIARGLREMPGVELLRVEHRELVARPGQVAEALNDFLCAGLGADLDVAAMAACVDPTLYRQRQHQSQHAPAKSDPPREG